MSLAAAPALDTDNAVAFGEHAKLDGLADTPLQAFVDVFLPISVGEVRFRFGEHEWIDTAVKMSIPGSARVTCHHDDGADGAVFGKHPCGRTTVTC